MEEEEFVKNTTTKVVLVTGASRGIGRAIAKKLSEKYIVVADYNKSEEEAKLLQEENPNIDIFKADVSKRKEVKKMVEYAINKYGDIDVLINNAGIDQEKMFQDITDEDWENIMKVNLYSVFYTTQETLKYMLNKKEGCIINISSIYGISGGSCAVAYSATKAGIDGMTKSLAKEVGPSNIRVNSIAPGCMNTDMNSYLTDEEWREIKEETPLKKIGEGIDIARCVEWLIEDEFTTGQVISINGGIVI
jgi:3-oxoacyl-[acyl-carrier protein] reductase